MNIGMGIYSGISMERQVELFKKLGIDRTFIGSETENFDRVMELFRQNGITCETLHAPYDRINDLWGEDEAAADRMLARLKDSVNKCHRYGIGVTIVHLSSGRPMPAFHDRGIRRFEELFRYAAEKGVVPALENQRYLGNLAYFMDRYDSPGFCWDCGHEYGFSKGIRFLELFGHRAVALHIHDNRCGDNTDDHLIPFDGQIDFESITQRLADSGYQGTLMLEISKAVEPGGVPVYAHLTDEEYVRRAVEAARRLAGMVDAKRK